MQTPYRKPGKYTNLRPDPLITSDKFLELQNELRHLKHIQPKAANDVAAAAKNGDFSENAEYQLAKGRLRGINDAIFRLEQQINQAEIITPKNNFNQVELGHRVIVESGGKQKTFLILGSAETSPENNVISRHSPIGSALMGHSVGDTVAVKLFNKEVNYKILKIE
ncbi:MAG: GreA/GreB family elongation factor [Candidatus Magasanikbacteria bacterium]|jgi:transcription elongation factor GreA